MRLLVLAVTILLTSCGVEDEPTTSVTTGSVDSAEWWPEEYPPRSDNVKQAVLEVASKSLHTGKRVFSLVIEKQEIYEKDSSLYKREVYCPIAHSYFDYKALERYLGLVTYPDAMAMCSEHEIVEFRPLCEVATSALFEDAPVATERSPSDVAVVHARNNAERFANMLYKSCIEGTQ